MGGRFGAALRRALGSDTTKPPAAKPAAKPTAKHSKAAAPKQAAQLRPQVPKAPSQALSTGPQPSSASPLQVRPWVSPSPSPSRLSLYPVETLNGQSLWLPAARLE